jgi:hypothetical protein
VFCEKGFSEFVVRIDIVDTFLTCGVSDLAS